VFAVGDICHRSVKRVASAVGEGSTCISPVHEHVAHASNADRPPQLYGQHARPSRRAGATASLRRAPR
jgi:hypothetical protein